MAFGDTMANEAYNKQVVEDKALAFRIRALAKSFSDLTNDAEKRGLTVEATAVRHFNATTGGSSILLSVDVTKRL